MAQIDLITRIGITKMGIESAFGTAPATTRVYPRAPAMLQTMQEKVAPGEERPTYWAHQAPRRGRKSGAGKLGFNFKPHAAQYDAAASAAATWQGIPLKGILGGQQFGAGSATTGAPTVNSIPITAAHGARFATGCWVAINVAGTLHARRVIGIAGDTLTVFPDLPVAPAAGQPVINSDTFFLAQFNSQSLAVQHGEFHPSDTNQQWEISGATGDLEVILEPGELAQFVASLRAATFQGPVSSLGLLPAAAASDPLGNPFVVVGATTWLQPASPATGWTHAAIESLRAKLNCGMVHTEEHGGVEGKSGVARNGPSLFGEVEVETRYDAAWETYYTNGTVLSLVHILPFGSGATQRFLVNDFPSVVIVQKPEPTDKAGRTVSKLVLETLEDTTIASPATDLARSPYRCALI